MTSTLLLLTQQMSMHLMDFFWRQVQECAHDGDNAWRGRELFMPAAGAVCARWYVVWGVCVCGVCVCACVYVLVVCGGVCVVSVVCVCYVCGGVCVVCGACVWRVCDLCVLWVISMRVV